MQNREAIADEVFWNCGLDVTTGGVELKHSFVICNILGEPNTTTKTILMNMCPKNPMSYGDKGWSSQNISRERSDEKWHLLSHKLGDRQGCH